MAFKKTGRKSGNPFFDITPEVIQKAEEYAAQGLTNDQIASCLGISSGCLYEKKAFHPELADAIKRGKASGIQKVANVIFQASLNGNVVSAMFFLKCRAQWNDREVDNKNNEETANKLIEEVKQLIDKSKMTI